MGQLTISMAIFNSCVSLPEGNMFLFVPGKHIGLVLQERTHETRRFDASVFLTVFNFCLGNFPKDSNMCVFLLPFGMTIPNGLSVVFGTLTRYCNDTLLSLFLTQNPIKVP